MSTKRVRVGVNGYGVIGKRVTDAVTLQEDMELVGVADVGFDCRVMTAVERGYPVYAALADRGSDGFRPSEPGRRIGRSGVAVPAWQRLLRST